jgi:hypothetical protein
MTDDRLFASNNAIGRKWYFFNLIILTFIVYITNYIFTNKIIPHVSSEHYVVIAEWTLYFVQFLYVITYLALLERRLYDICGTRDSKSYRNGLAFIFLYVFLIIFGMFCAYKNPPLPFPNEIVISLGYLASGLLALKTLIFCLIKSSISTLSYEEYRKKLKYE